MTCKYIDHDEILFGKEDKMLGEINPNDLEKIAQQCRSMLGGEIGDLVSEERGSDLTRATLAQMYDKKYGKK